jgi:subtilisin family serine protease
MRKLIFILLLTVFSSHFTLAGSFIIKIKSSGNGSLQSSSLPGNVRPYLQKGKLAEPVLLSKNQQDAYSELEKYFIADNLSPDEIEKLKNNPDIESITPNHFYKVNKIEEPNDSLFDEQWALKQVKALEALEYADGSGVIIGIIDTGIDLSTKI